MSFVGASTFPQKSSFCFSRRDFSHTEKGGFQGTALLSRSRTSEDGTPDFRKLDDILTQRPLWRRQEPNRIPINALLMHQYGYWYIHKCAALQTFNFRLTLAATIHPVNQDLFHSVIHDHLTAALSLHFSCTVKVTRTVVVKTFVP